jgi:hypothetical protein
VHFLHSVIDRRRGYVIKDTVLRVLGIAFHVFIPGGPVSLAVGVSFS